MEAYWHARSLVDPVLLVPIEDDGVDDQDAYAISAEAPAKLVAHDAREALREALLRLPERDRQVVLLYYARDCSLAEIGAILDVSPSRVCQILTAARERLRKAIGREFGMGDLREGVA